MSEIDLFPRHGLKHNTKHRAYKALLDRQQGKCFICGVSHIDLQEKYRGEASVHITLHIDHCHKTGMIRGLLCGRCNGLLGMLENCGFRPKPDMPPLFDESDSDDESDDEYDDEETFAEICDRVGQWLGPYMNAVLLYMQPERWLTLQEVKQMAFAVRDQEIRDHQTQQQA